MLWKVTEVREEHTKKGNTLCLGNTTHLLSIIISLISVKHLIFPFDDLTFVWTDLGKPFRVTSNPSKIWSEDLLITSQEYYYYRNMLWYSTRSPVCQVTDLALCAFFGPYLASVLPFCDSFHFYTWNFSSFSPE